ncbi:MAG: flavin reductase family protein [Burkholderiales bacterium]|nr:flavin reductase family protein [Burkholderiales bacterium]
MQAALIPETDPALYRKALGCFATGVAVVTTVTAAGAPVGLTVNSFSSVSLEPALVLWSLRRQSSACEIFSQASCFAVNLLQSAQEDISTRFASRGAEKFEGLRIRHGLDGVPLLPDCVAAFECRTVRTHIEGDHLLFIGRVERFTLHPDTEPLIYCRGAYARRQSGVHCT